jgi:hypothetical protein
MKWNRRLDIDEHDPRPCNAPEYDRYNGIVEEEAVELLSGMEIHPTKQIDWTPLLGPSVQMLVCSDVCSALT